MVASARAISSPIVFAAGACLGVLLGSLGALPWSDSASAIGSTVGKPGSPILRSTSVPKPAICEEANASCPSSPACPSQRPPAPTPCSACPSPPATPPNDGGDSTTTPSPAGSATVAPPATTDDDFSPFLTRSFLRASDLHMRGVCVEPNMPYKLYGLTRESCGDKDFYLHTRNATKGRVTTCSYNDGLARSVCRQTGLYCDKVADPFNGAAYDPNKLLFIHRASLAPMEFWDQNLGHIITDGVTAYAAARGVETGVASRTRATATGAITAITDHSPLYLWRARGKPFGGQALTDLWNSLMFPRGIRYLPHADGIVCFDSAVIIAQPLNMVSWDRLSSSSFLIMSESWQTSSRLIQWPEGDARAATIFDDATAKAAAAAVDARGGDFGMGLQSRAAVVLANRARRKRMTAAAPAELTTGPKCGDGAGARRKPKALVVVRTGRRKVRNMKDLIEWLKSKGYDASVWDPSGAPGKQAAEIQAADLFITNHGQAQAWGMFMREDAAMITVCSDNQLQLGTCAYYGVAARNSGHSPRRVFRFVSPDAQFHGGQRTTDAQMQATVKSHGIVAGEWHYKQTHWDDIDVNIPLFEKAWAEHLGGEDAGAESFWNWWCDFDDVVRAVDNSDAESLPTEDAGMWVATRVPRLADGIMHM